MRGFVLGVQSVSHAEFRKFIGAETAILLVGRGHSFRFAPGRHFSAAVAKYFRAEYPGIELGTFDREQVASQEWLIRQVRGAFADDAPGGAPDGYFLFRKGRPIAYHSGHVERGDPVADVLAAFAKARGDDSLTRDGAAAVIECFEDAIASPPMKSMPSKRTQETVSVPRRPFDPFALLSADAPKAEAKAVRDAALLQNHPDRVAMMDPEIQELAKRRTEEINRAWAALVKKRGW